MRKLLAFVFVFVSFYSGWKAQSICGGSSATIVATSTLSNPTYTLNPGNFSPITNTNTNTQYFVVSPGVTTTYTLVAASGTVTNYTPITVTVNAQPNTAITLTQAVCTNSFNAVNLGLTFNPASPPPAYTISWTPLPASVLSPQQFTATNLTPGPYSLTISGPGGCNAVVFFTMNPQPAPALFTVTPFGSTHSITCVTPSVDLSANNNNLTYTWTGAAFTPVNSQSISLNSTHLGTLSVTGQNTVSGCVSTYTFLLAQNIAVPSSSISTTLINITCSQTLAPTLSVTSSPTVNVTHYIYAPQNATFSATSYTTIYYPGGPGTYTHVLVNDANGCFVVKHFTVTTSDNYPIYTVTSPNSFTLGCNSKTIGVISIDGAATTPTAGGPVSYTILSPTSSTTIPFGVPLGTVSVYTNVTVPGIYTVIVRDNTNNCDTRTQISVLQLTMTPDISAIVPLQVLDCNNPKVILTGVSETSNVSYNWGFTGTPGNIVGSTITVNTSTAPTATIINTFTLTITDPVNTCKSTSIIPMYQNTFPPTTSITGGATFISCISPTVVLTNQSKTGIPNGTPFPTNQPVIGYLWEGPSPQVPLQVNTTYTAATVGIYTLTGKDLNNGCVSKANYTITDNKIYPTITPRAFPDTLDCGAASVLLEPNITGVTTGLTYSWTNPPGSLPTGSNTVKNYQVSSPGTFSLVVTNTVNGCKTPTTMKVITGSLTAAFLASEESGYAPLNVIFTNNSSSASGSSSIIASWSFGNGTVSGSVTPSGSFVPGPVSGSVSPSVVYSQPGTYTVALYVTKGACLDTAYKVIKVDIPSALEIPNVFTPNGDGINDIYFLGAKNLTEINMVIYDRWGQVVYELISTTGNIEWDGKNGFGKECAEGTYFYTLKTIGKDGVANDKKGTINLYR